MSETTQPAFEGVIFDMDGTLTVPCLDFDAIRKEIGLPDGGDLAVQIAEMSPQEQAMAWEIIERHESRAIEKQELQEGCAELLERCRQCGVRLGVVTRNVEESARQLCARFSLEFDTILTREFEHMKPHPGPILHILGEWDLDAPNALTVGDYIHDIQCGSAAGTRTCYFQNPGRSCVGCTPDHVVSSMAELEALLFPAAEKPEPGRQEPQARTDEHG